MQAIMSHPQLFLSCGSDFEKEYGAMVMAEMKYSTDTCHVDESLAIRTIKSVLKFSLLLLANSCDKDRYNSFDVSYLCVYVD